MSDLLLLLPTILSHSKEVVISAHGKKSLNIAFCKRLDGERLDVVWRRVEKSVPTYAFEIQVGGDLYHALAKLKHAYDIWNSNIYIVTEEKYRDRIEELLAGTFHEIRNALNVINLEQINYLYSLQAEDVKLRREMRLP